MNQSDGENAADIVVTAERREKRAQDVPIALSAVTGQRLEETGLRDPGQLRFLVPGLGAVSQSQTPSNVDFSIRGNGTNSFSNSVEFNVSTVLDDIVLTRPAMGVIQYFDVDQVEVLRGAQVTLYGKNASAGVVNIRTIRPKLGVTELKVGFDAGEIETRDRAFNGRLDAAMNIPVSDNSALRVSAFGLLQGPLVSNPEPNRIDDGQKEGGVKVKFLWEPTDSFHIYAVADYAREAGQGQHQFVARSINSGFPLPADLTALFASQGVVPGPDNDRCTYIGCSSTAIYTTDFEAGGAQIEAGYTFDNGYSVTGIFGYRSGWLNNIQNGDAGQPQYGADLETVDNQKQLTAEVRVASPLGGFLDWQGGIYLLRGDYDKYSVAYQNAGALPAPGFAWRLGNELDSRQVAKSAAAYAEFNLHPTRKLTFIAGGRYTYDYISNSNVTVQGTAQVAAFVPGAFVQSRHVTNFAFKLGSKYAFSSNVTGYVTYTLGYKGPAFNSTASPQLAIPVDPEIPHDWEAGLKLATSDRRLTLSLSLFDERIENYQANSVITEANGARTTALFNAGRAHTRGAEMEVAAKPTHSLSLGGSIVYADARFDSFPRSPCYVGQTAAQGCVTIPGTPVLQFTDAAGASLGNAPAWTYTGQAQYTTELSPHLSGFIAVDGYYRTSADFSTNNNPFTRVPGYGIVDARLGIAGKDKSWRLSLYVNNLFDQRFPSSVQASPQRGIYLQTFSPNSFRGFGLQGSFGF